MKREYTLLLVKGAHSQKIKVCANWLTLAFLIQTYQALGNEVYKAK